MPTRPPPPATRSAVGTPKASASAPVMKAPSGKTPPNISVWRLITRPRSSSGVVSWRVVLQLAMKTIE